MDIELFNQLPVGSHLAKRINGQYTISIRPLKAADIWERFIADTPDEAVKDALGWLKEIERRGQVAL